MKASWDVFVSYSRRDATTCERIVRDLHARGFRVWHDQAAIMGGERIRESIAEGLRGSACVVALLSSHSLRSKWVLNELDATMLREIKERKTLLIPVLLGKLRDDQVPLDLQGKLHIDLRFRLAARYEAGFGLLVKSIQLISPQRASRVGGSRLLDADFISHLYTRKYKNRDRHQLSEKGWQGFVEAFLEPDLWHPDFAEALREFSGKYGSEAVKRLLVFVFDLKGIDFDGFTQERLNDAFHEAQYFVMMMSVSEYSKEDGHRGIAYSVGTGGKVAYRLVKRGS
jgi:hypothetical protein